MEALQYHQPDYLLKGRTIPDEDAHAVRGDAFVVADGITRDPIYYDDWTGIEKERLINNYPNPSPAAEASQLFCQTFIRTVDSENPSEQALRKAMIAGNQAIARLNEGKEIDYLTNDFAACVAAGGIINTLKLYWVSIGDCQVTIFDRGGRRKFTSPNGTENWREYEAEHPDNWNKPEYRVKVRSQFRNNPNQIINGKLISYGAITGEAAAEPFINSGVEKLERGDTVICFSDGFCHHLEHAEFWDHFSRGVKEFSEWEKRLVRENPKKYGHERTMIALR